MCRPARHLDEADIGSETGDRPQWDETVPGGGVRWVDVDDPSADPSTVEVDPHECADDGLRRQMLRHAVVEGLVRPLGVTQDADDVRSG